MKAEVSKVEKTVTVDVTREMAGQWPSRPKLHLFLIFAMQAPFAASSNLDRFRRNSRSAEFVELVRTSRPCLLGCCSQPDPDYFAAYKRVESDPR